MTDYTPNRADWLRAIWGASNLEFSGPPLHSLRSLRLGGECFGALISADNTKVAEIAQRRAELRAMLQFLRFTNVIRQSIVRRHPSINESFRNGNY